MSAPSNRGLRAGGRVLCCCVWLWLFSFHGLASLRAERMPAFDLDLCSQRAQLIVRGELQADGTVKVAEVLKGKSELGGVLRLSDGKNVFESLDSLNLSRDGKQ